MLTFSCTKEDILIQFILNNQEITTSVPAGTLLLDFVRYHRNLTGTKIGCREGDCGACSVLVGELRDGNLRYTSATSCLMPVGNAHGKHIVTIEGINIENSLTIVQQAMYNQAATQCGFCTPGFVTSLTGFCLSDSDKSFEHAIESVDGNICRCTGYKSIERAINDIVTETKGTESTIEIAVTNKIVPAYFLTIKERLQQLQTQHSPAYHLTPSKAAFVGGGTDLFVQNHDGLSTEPHFLHHQNELKTIFEKGDNLFIGGTATVTDLVSYPHIENFIPGLRSFFKLVSSTPIRNMATIAGNLVNASPIGDFTIILLALNAQLHLDEDGNTRTLALKDFYAGYKQLNKSANEVIRYIEIAPAGSALFSFEKISKRTHLDIASVNSACWIEVEGEVIKQIRLSAGGVAATPKLLTAASNWLKGRTMDVSMFTELMEVIDSEISPISDARGTSDYKRRLLQQLVKAHFIKHFPQISASKILAV